MTDFVFYKYDKNNKKIEKVNEIATKAYIYGLQGKNNGNILTVMSNYIYIIIIKVFKQK